MRHIKEGLNYATSLHVPRDSLGTHPEHILVVEF
jgi:hypothetical protein